MKMTEKEYKELMSHFYFIADKVEDCYFKEVQRVLEKLEKEYKKYVTKY